jgi:hypothetical protein
MSEITSAAIQTKPRNDISTLAVQRTLVRGQR